MRAPIIPKVWGKQTSPTVALQEATIADELQQRATERIRALAEKKGIALSHLAGVSRLHFWSVMAGEKSPTLQWIVRVASALEIDPGELLQPLKKTAR